MKKIITLAMLFVILLTSCKKEKSPEVLPIEPPVDLSNSVFKGVTTLANAGAEKNCEVTFFADGALKYKIVDLGNSLLFDGYWSKAPNSNLVSMTCISGNLVFKGPCTLSTNNTKIDGSLQQVGAPGVACAIKLTKQ